MIASLDEVRYKGRFVFPNKVEKELGTHGVFWVSVPYSKDIIRVRKLYAEDEFLVKYLIKGGTLIKNRKTRKKIEFPNKISVITENQFLKRRFV